MKVDHHEGIEIVIEDEIDTEGEIEEIEGIEEIIDIVEGIESVDHAVLVHLDRIRIILPILISHHQMIQIVLLQAVNNITIFKLFSF